VFFPISSSDNASNYYVSGQGVVLLAEKYDKRWRLLMNGRSIPIEEHPFGIPMFKILEAGEFSLFHDGTYRRAWISFQLIVLMTAIVLALPAGRRKREVPLQELV
jgi:hypothetical protein